jgi:CheY-like chemotaxis protein/two-component sensor histidine kinase
VQLIEDLLDVARIATGKLHLDFGPIDFAAVIDSALDLARGGAEAKRLRLVATIDPAVRAFIGDAARLQQVVWNLLSNAIRFTPDGGRITVTVTRTETRVLLTVSDTGHGISPDLLPHIFERFRQGHLAGRVARGGLGLGLAIARQIVELHRGTIEAHSDGEGRGATFVVSLPLTGPAPTVESAGADTAPRPGFPSLTGIRVLLVEDDTDGRTLIAEVLRQCGSEVVEAGSTAEALEVLDGSRVDVLVSDIGLPDQDGFHLMRTIRGRPADRGGSVPALAVTGFARVEDRRRALLAGFQTHVSKPVEPLELAVVVANLLGRGRQSS